MKKEIVDLLKVEVARRPFQHQIDALNFFYDKPEALYLWEMGTGKTGGAIFLQRLRCYQEKKFVNTLIVTPLVTVYNWQDEIPLFSPYPKDRVIALTQETSAKKLAYLEKRLWDKEHYIVIVNYDALLNEKLFDKLLHLDYDCIIFDEAHRLKDPSAKRSKLCTRLADKAKYKILLTGTLILNSLKDIYSPFRILDKGATFGTNQYVFFNTYMRDKNAAWKGRHNYFPDWVIREDKQSEITEKIYTKAVRKLKSECLDLPPLVEEIEYVEMGKDQKKHYEEMKRDFITFVKEHKNSTKPKAVVAELAMTKALKLLQIASGFVKTEEGDIVYFEDVPRLNRCKELLENILSEGHKCILWTSFIANTKMLERVCQELNVRYVKLTGDENIEEKNENIKSFQSDNEVRVVIANRRAGGIGVNLTAASYSIVFSRNHNLEDEKQSEARNYRSGSEIHERITKIDLACKGTIDEECLMALKNKQKLASLIVDSEYLEDRI